MKRVDLFLSLTVVWTLWCWPCWVLMTHLKLNSEHAAHALKCGENIPSHPVEQLKKNTVR